MRAFSFLVREALINLRRHGLMTTAAVSTIAVALALLGAFLVTFYQVDTAAHRTVDAFEMRVFCRREVDTAAAQRLKPRLARLPGVASVRYLSREAIWKEQTRNYPIDTAGIPNQMPDTFVIKLSDGKRAAAIAREIRGWHREVDGVDLPEKEMGSVLRLAEFVRNVGFVAAAALLLGALVVVSNTIRISVFSRRREIKIMQLVGATPWFIRLPLFLEGLIHGILGGAVAGICLIAAGRYLSGVIQENVPMLVSYGGAVDLPRFGLALVALGALIGAFGSLVSIRRDLRSV